MYIYSRNNMCIYIYIYTHIFIDYCNICIHTYIDWCTTYIYIYNVCITSIRLPFGGLKKCLMILSINPLARRPV